MNNKNLYDKITRILNNEDKTPMVTLEAIRKELETEIITGGKINNSIKQAFKRVQKEMEGRRFQYVLRNGDNKYTVINGYFLVTYTKEQLPKELEAYVNPNEKEIDDGLQFDRCKNREEISGGEYKLQNMSLNYEALLKIHKYLKINKKRDMFTMNDGFTFNIQYFLDILAFLGQKDLRNVTLEKSENNIHPMNIYTENGNAILLPIRMEKEQVEEQLRLQEQIMKEA